MRAELRDELGLLSAILGTGDHVGVDVPQAQKQSSKKADRTRAKDQRPLGVPVQAFLDAEDIANRLLHHRHGLHQDSQRVDRIRDYDQTVLSFRVELG